MKLFKIILILFLCNLINYISYGQANPYITVLPENSGLVTLGNTLNIQVTIGNIGTSSIVANKLRPIITVPPIVTILPNAQQPDLPSGWSIVSNNGSQIRICNGTDIIAGNTVRNITIKVQAVSVGGPSSFNGQLNFGGANCNTSGPQPTGNSNSDDNSISSITVAPGCNLTLNATAGNVLCNGGSTTITALPINATGPVEYKISGTTTFQNSNTFTVNASGSPYTITAREIANPNSCVTITNVIITEPTPLLPPTLNIAQPTCALSSGVVTITSPTIGLTFSLNAGPFENYPINGYNLTAGPHSIEVKNANNCISSVSFNLNNQPTTPLTPTIGTITQPSCTNSNGSVSLSGLPTGNWVLNPGNIAGNTATTIVNNLAPGNYNFTVTNAVGCTSVLSNIVNINTVFGAPIEPVVNIIQPTCTNATGSITISGSTVGLLYSLDGGLFSSYPNVGYTVLTAGSHSLVAQNNNGCLSPVLNFVINPQPLSPINPSVSVTQPTCTVATGVISITTPTNGLTFSLNTGSFSNYPTGGYVVPAGVYNISVQNNNGCAPTLVSNIVVNPQPVSPTAVIAASTIICFGNTSTITVVGNAGVMPYQYSLNNGPFQLSNEFIVTAGTYIVTVKDANGCTGISNSLNVVQPNVIAASISSGLISCFGGSTTLTVQATGGVGAFEYSLNNGPYQTSNTFNITAGTFTARARLITLPSCFANTSSLTIVQPTVFNSTAKALPIYYCGGSTEIKVEATGGKLPYSGIGKYIKGPGKWNFTVTDANGCTSSSEVIILAPACIDLKAYPNPTQNIITINHSEAGVNSKIQIYGMKGNLVYSKAITQGSILTNIDLSSFASEGYLLVFTNGGERKEIKILKGNSK